MAVNQKTELTVQPWVPSMFPGKPDIDALVQYLTRELDRLRATIATLTNAANQATDVAPKTPVNGMVRYAEGAWATSLAGTGLYVYKAGAWAKII